MVESYSTDSRLTWTVGVRTSGKNFFNITSAMYRNASHTCLYEKRQRKAPRGAAWHCSITQPQPSDTVHPMSTNLKASQYTVITSTDYTFRRRCPYGKWKSRVLTGRRDQHHTYIGPD